MRRFSELTEELSKKIENHAKADAIRLHASDHGKLRLIGCAIGIVLLLAGWLASHP